MRSSRLSALPTELLSRIAYYASAPLGPPASVLTLHLTCRSIHNALVTDRTYLYERIFRLKFDIEGPRRRLGDEILRPSSLASELRRRCLMLQRIRRRIAAGPAVLEDLWLAYLMLLENDGRNERQLINWAGLRDYALSYLAQNFLHERDSSGWPIESEENALAVWLLWLSNDEESISSETKEVQNLVLRSLQPFVIAPFKYQAAFVPDTHFALPLFGSQESNPPPCVSTPHGAFPVYREPVQSITFTHFGRPLALAAPPLTPAALLCIHARRQCSRMQTPDGLPTRRSDLPPHAYGVTDEDYDEVNERVLTRCIQRPSLGGDQSAFVEDIDGNVGEDFYAMCVDDHEGVSLFIGQTPSGVPDSSWQHERDWQRLVRCYDPWLDAKIKIRVYTPGMLNGLWAGRMFTYDMIGYREISQEQRAPAALFEVGAENYPFSFQTPVFMTLREHYCLGEHMPIGWGQGVYDREADGLSNAYFPFGTEFYEDKDRGQVKLLDPHTDEILTYETLEQLDSPGAVQYLPPRSSFALPPEQYREAEQIFFDEGLGNDADAWNDTVENGCIHDIIITGETDPVHSKAWDPYRFYGRIRDYDGLIVLLRVPAHRRTRGQGTFIFRGYIHSNQNFVGRWRAASEPSYAFSTIEGNFSMCKWE